MVLYGPSAPLPGAPVLHAVQQVPEEEGTQKNHPRIFQTGHMNWREGEEGFGEEWVGKEGWKEDPKGKMYVENGRAQFTQC